MRSAARFSSFFQQLALLGIAAAALASAGFGSGQYILGPADQLSVRVLDLDEIADRPVRIDANGDVHLPLAGVVHAQGLTTNQLESRIVALLRTYVKEPRVTVTVAEFRSEPLSVLGAVNSPGVRQIHEPKRLFEALSDAGGLREDAGPIIELARPVANGPIPLPGSHQDSAGEFYLAELSAKSVLSAQNPEENIPIFPHDIVSVPRAEMIFVLGEVNHPGGFEIGTSQTVSVLDALARAGGSLHSAQLSHARVLRHVPGKLERVDQSVDLTRILQGKTQDFALEAQDILFIPVNKGKVVATRAIEAMIGAGSGIAVFRSSR